MRDLSVLGDSGPRLLGVMLSCARNYATLDDLEFEQGRKERLFFALLNARIVLATLRSALTLKRLSYPGDLYRLSVTCSPVADPPPGLRLPCSGKEIYDWAMDLETKVCEAIDSFGSSRAESLLGHDTLVSLMLMLPDSITVDGISVAERVLLMLDDVHKLTSQQRERLVRTAIDLRSPIGVWIAERFEALSADEMLALGATEGRDYESVVFIEKFWRDKRSKRFENMVLNIADRRARSASDIEIGSFSSCLQTSLDGTEWLQRFSEVLDVVVTRARDLASSQSLFQEWVAARGAIGGTPRERAIAWRTLEILIEREKRKSQRMFDFALSVDALEEKDDSAAKAAAELFLANEFELPYYFGPSRLAALASSNVEQFLSLSGDEFEEVVSAALLKQATDLTPDRQHVILKRAAQNRWNDIPRRVRHGREVRDFLEAIGTFSRWITYQPNAPNDPGVNGIAISMADRDRLMDREYLKTRSKLEKLAVILASALAHNLLEPDLDYKCKGERWMVLNLNRLLCVYFDLPLHYGKFKERTLTELCHWLEQGFKPPKKGGEFLL